ncbi:hypothetical protein M7784_14780, partial [Desulfovibrio aminophilus]
MFGIKRSELFFAVILPLMAFSAVPSQAQDRGAPYALEEVTVTARAVPTPVSKTPGGVEVMDA